MSICCIGGTGENPCPCQLTQADLKGANLGVFDSCKTPGCGHSYGLHIPDVAPAPGNTRLRWPFILHLLLINCTFGLDVIEEFDMMRKQVKVLEQELSDSLSVVPDRFIENLRHSTVQILDENSAPAGIGFFISTQIVVATHHNIGDLSEIRASITSADGQMSIHTLTFAPSMEANAEKCKELDLAILTTETVHPHYLSIFSLDANESHSHSPFRGSKRMGEPELGARERQRL